MTSEGLISSISERLISSVDKKVMYETRRRSRADLQGAINSSFKTYNASQR